MPPWIEVLAQQDDKPNMLITLLVSWGPLVFIFLLIYFFIVKKAGTSQSDQLKRYHEHLDKVEAGYDEIIGQLRELNQTLKDKDRQP